MQDEVVNLHTQLGHLKCYEKIVVTFVRMVEKSSSLETDSHFLI